MTSHQYRVYQFMQKAGQTCRLKPTSDITEQERILRAKLTLEEALEKIEAMGVLVTQNLIDGGFTHFSPKGQYEFKITGKVDLEKWLDGICDLQVVNTGDLVTLGIDGEIPQLLVDGANLQKFEPLSCPTCHSRMRLIKRESWPDFVYVCLGCNDKLPKEAGPHRRADGKWVKGPNWQPPALKEELRRQGCTESL